LLCRSADGWSFHAPGSSDEAIAKGDAYVVPRPGIAQAKFHTAQMLGDAFAEREKRDRMRHHARVLDRARRLVTRMRAAGEISLAEVRLLRKFSKRLFGAE